MRLSTLAVAAGLLWLSGAEPLVSAADATPPAEFEFFEKHVRPLLAKRCFGCHGGTKAEGGLSLATMGGWQQGGDSGPAIVPGRPDESLLIEAINHRSLQMPPEDEGGQMPADEIDILTRWVAMGAPDPRSGDDAIGGMTGDEARAWWAFQPLPAGPPLTSRDIDALLEREWAARSLVPAPPADRQTLIRRAAYDLTGLPPTPEQTREFLADESPAAFAHLIDQQLESPQYGVRWGRHWLDVVRYADTAGENTDRPLPQAWRYRNWVFEAFQHDMPFDRFAALQIAGDLLTREQPATQHAEGIVATGYLAIARRFGHDIDADIHLMHEDAIDNLGKGFLGLTVACARCHDHKYDPINADDYYALYGILASSRFAFPGCEPQGQPRDLVPLIPQSEIDAAMEAWRQRHADDRDGQVALAENVTPVSSADASQATQASQQEAGPEQAVVPPPAIPVAYAVVDREAAKAARIHDRGDPEKLGDEVPRRWLTAFGGDPVTTNSESGRRELAGWITGHPLFARVIVNRIWAWHFGRGLVASANDFGTRGEPPTHPELLDRLAAEFVRGGHSIKAMHHLVMLTAAYQRAGATPITADPDNRWLAHFSRRRLDADELRDSLLAASGRIDLSFAEAHPFPDEQTWKFTQHHPFNAVYETNRRSAFLMVQRQRRHPFLSLFDGADPNASTPVRQTTTVPTQALYFMNDPFFHEQAAAVAARLVGLGDDEARTTGVFQTVFQRDPTPVECDRVRRILADYPGEPQERWAAVCRILLASNEFLSVE